MTRFLRWSILAACALLLRYDASPLARVGVIAHCGPTQFVVVAATRAERSRGIQQERDFRGAYGMLFVYDVPQRPAFWMRDTEIPLDIVFFDSEYRVIGTAKMQPFTTERQQPHVPIVAALEVRAVDNVQSAYPVGTHCMVTLPMR